MNILFVFGWPMRIGGHYRSGIALMKYLKSLGHCLYTMAPDAVKEVTYVLENEGIHFIPFPEVSYHELLAISGVFRVVRICKKFSIDVIHSQDIQSACPGHLAAIVLKRGFVYTKAGGPPNKFSQPNHVESVYYSQELVDAMTQMYATKNNNVSLVKARIDTETYKPAPVSSDFMKKYDLPTKGQKIVIAMRFVEQKRPWIRTLLQFIEYMCREDNNEIQLIVAGEGPLLSEFKRHSYRVISDNKSRNFVHIIGPLFDPNDMVQLYNYSHLVLGSGRGILEAMACKKPVVVLGEKGEGETVSPNSFQIIEKYNFSGRHFRYQQCQDYNLPIFLKHLLRCNKKLDELASFSYEYIKNHMDARIGAKQLDRIYRKASTYENSLVDYITWYARLNWQEITTPLRNRLFLRTKNQVNSTSILPE